MGMSSYVMDCEDMFIDEVSARIGECEHVSELFDSLKKDNCFKLIAHFSESEKSDFVDELWSEFWSSHD